MIQKIATENLVELHMFAQLGQTSRFAGRQHRGLKDTFQSLRPGQQQVNERMYTLILTLATNLTNT